MAYVNQDVEIYAGDAKDLDVTIYDDKGEVLDLSGYSIFYYVYGSSGIPIITKTTDDGIDVLGNGKLIVTLKRDDTKKLFGEYSHEIDLLENQNVYTVMIGKLTVLPSVVTEVEA